MSEIVNYVAMASVPAAAYLVGAGHEYIVQRRNDAEREPATEQMAALLGQQPELSRKQRIMSAMVGGMAIAGAAFGTINTLAWSQQPPEQQDATMIEIAADFSGATNISTEGERPIDATREIISLFDDTADFDTQVFVASGGSTTVKTAEQAIDMRPFGPAPVDQAVSDAFNSIELARADGSDAPAAVLVLSHGNSIGDPDVVVGRATTDSGETTPIYVVNTEGEAVNADTEAQLKAIAERTGGEYWSPDEATVENIEPLAEELAPEDQPIVWKHSLVERIGATAVSVLIAAGLYRLRRNQTSSVNGEMMIVPEDNKKEK